MILQRDKSTVAGRTRPNVDAVLRLRHITGFATTYGEQTDPRTLLFARIWHVRRVVAVARILLASQADLSRRRVLKLAWLHDLNRWPFAHNSERHRFDQTSNTPAYLATHFAEYTTEADVLDLVGIQGKSLDGLSAEARLVLLADAIAGVIEDPLLLICGLNVRPDIVPVGVGKVLGFQHTEEPWRQRCHDLAMMLHGGGSVASLSLFQRGLRSIFLEQVRWFIDAQPSGDVVRHPERTLESVRWVKTNFLRPVVFPINNELVSRSTWINTIVMPWYLERFDKARLLYLGEPEFVEVVTTAGAPFTAPEFVPRIDAIRCDQPDLAFVR